MPISAYDYRNFYFGTGVEYYILSQLYMMGFEAYKANPDIGYDLYVTNLCKIKYKKSERINFNIQVKSSLFLEKHNEFWLSIDDYNMIKNDVDGILVCALHKPISCADPNSFHYNRDSFHEDQMYKAIEQGAMDTFINDFRKYTIDEADEIFKLVDFDIEYFWLNNKHIQRLEKEGYIYNRSKDDKLYKAIIVTVRENKRLHIDCKHLNNEEDELNYLVPEVKSLYYLVNNNSSTDRLRSGDLFAGDNDCYR